MDDRTSIRIGSTGINRICRSSYSINSFLGKIRGRTKSFKGSIRKEREREHSTHGEDHKNGRGEETTRHVDNRNYETYVRRLKEAQGQLQQYSNGLDQLNSEIQKYVLSQFDKSGGSINYIPCKLHETLELSKGWSAKLELHNSESDIDVFVCKAEKGSEIAEHWHFQIEWFTALSGKYECISVDPKTNEATNNIINRKKSLQIESNFKHKFKALETGECVVMFHPCITTPNKTNDESI